MTSRSGGRSSVPFEGFNLRCGLGDDDDIVALHRRQLHGWLGVPSVRLDQVHGVVVHGIGPGEADGRVSSGTPVADASVTTLERVACEIQVADCLPVLFADRAGRAVGAAHAGWRGLAGGVLEATLKAVCAAAGVPPQEVEAWLGPCIGSTRFEVGADLLAAFDAPDAAAGLAGSRFVAAGSAGPEAEPKWWADLAGLARDRLQQARVGRVFGNDGSVPWCTFSQPARFYSYRRDGRTGRMAALIWRDPQA
jgi:YfiH family protein